MTALAALLGLACDPSEAVDASRKANAAHDEKEAEPAQAADEKKAEDDDFEACMEQCVGPDTRPTDRQTCRLRCEADRPGADAGPTSTSRAMLGRYETCLDGCANTRDPTDAATCRLNCAQSAVTSGGPQALTEPQRSCSVSCLEKASECQAECTGSKDDAATCRAQCTGVGEHCLQQCQEKSEAKAPAEGSAPEAKADSP